MSEVPGLWKWACNCSILISKAVPKMKEVSNEAQRSSWSRGQIGSVARRNLQLLCFPRAAESFRLHHLACFIMKYVGSWWRGNQPRFGIIVTIKREID